MTKKSDYDKIYEKNAKFLSDYYKMLKNNLELKNNNKYTNEYFRLSTVKKRLLDNYQNYFEGSLLFSEMIKVGSVNEKMRRENGYYNILKKNPILDDLHLYIDENEKISDDFKFKINDKMMLLQIDVSQEIFSEERINRLIKSIFQYNHAAFKNILREDQIEYYAKVSAMMVQYGIQELKKYMGFQFGRLLMQDLDRVDEICRIMFSQKNREIHEYL